jgi:alanine racemase
VRPLIRARIDGSALQHNLRRLKALAPRSRVMAVIKANAYGHGLVATAQILQAADALAVARIEEGVLLREAGIQNRVVLLEGVLDAAQLAEAARHRFDLVVHEPGAVALLQAWRGAHRFDLWLKVDSGMNRLGFRPEQAADVWQRLSALQPRALRLMTHLATADEPDGAPVALQMARFEPLRLQLAAGPGAGIAAPMEVSIANSAAVLGLPLLHADWIRPGIALYGVSPFDGATGAQHGLRPAMQLEATVIALREVPVGEIVGYAGRWRAARPTRLAIVAAGYGDGLLRSFPDGTPVLIDGRRAPLAGRVSMDMIAVDVTDLPPVQVGDTAQIWGPELPVEQQAAAAGTIAYELLCSVRQRVPRSYERDPPID